MLSDKLNIRAVIKNHLDTFKSRKGKYLKSDISSFLIIPAVISLVLVIVKRPDSNIQEILSICISVLIGLLLNLLVLILSNISAKDVKISMINARKRIALIKETYYNIAFSILLCLFTLGVIFIYYVFDKSVLIDGSLKELFENPNYIYKASCGVIGIVLYFLLIQIFLHLFLVLKRITKIFIKDMELMNVDNKGSI